MGEQKLRVLVTGANGFVGRAVCEKLLEQGYSVRGAVRTLACPSGVESVKVADIDAETDWSKILSDVDVVIHLAARVHVMQDEAEDPLAEFLRINKAGSEHLARCAAASGVKRMVYVSSIKVNGEKTQNGRRFSDRDSPAPQDPYGISKWEAEQVLQNVACETGLEVVIVRPPLVYGAGVKGNFAQMLHAVRRGIPLPFGSVRNQRDLIYVGNLADALITCAMHPAAAGQTYLLSDNAPVSTPELLRKLAQALGVPSRVFPFPLVLLKVAGRLTGKSMQVDRLLGSLQVDSAKIRRELDWSPPFTLQQGLQKTVGVV